MKYLNPKKFFTASVLFSGIFFLTYAQVPAPGKRLIKGLYIFNATIHDGEGKVWSNGFIQIDSGKITGIGESKNTSENNIDQTRFDVLNAEGKHLYPGFISLNTPLGLNEVDAVRATLDQSEPGSDNPNVNALVAYNTDSDLIPTIRSNGVLMAQIAPRGKGLRGLSSVVQLDAWNWEDAVIKDKDGLHMVWPSKYSVQGWWAEPGKIDQSKEYQNQRADLEKLFTDARMHLNSKEKKINTRLESLGPVFQGKTKLYLHADFAADIVSGLEFARKHQIPDLVLVTGSSVIEVLDLIVERKVPLILSRIHSLPVRPDDPVHFPIEVPARLLAAGVVFALDYKGDMEIMGSRNLAFLAGSASRYGISEEKALSLITLNPARILGIDKTTGSLAPGKDATFFLSEGNALNMSTQKLTHAWIQGRPVSLESKQTALHKKFKKMLDQGRY